MANEYDCALVKCGCNEWPECTHVLYFYEGFKYATAPSAEPTPKPSDSIAEKLSAGLESAKAVTENLNKVFGKAQPKPSGDAPFLSAMREQPTALSAEWEREMWQAVAGQEDDDWGIRLASESSGMSIAQMMWADDALEAAASHNDRLRATQPTGLREALVSANEMCRSAYQIAARSGQTTNWEAFRGQLEKSLTLQSAALSAATPERGAR